MGGPLAEVDGIFFQGLVFLGFFRALLVSLLFLLGSFFLFQAMGEIFGHIQLADSLGMEEIHRERLGLGKDGGQDIPGIHLFFAAALDVGNGPLQDPVETEGLDGVVGQARLDHGQVGSKKLLQPFLHPLGIAAADHNGSGSQLVIQQAVKNMLHRHMFVPSDLCLPDGSHQGYFQLCIYHFALLTGNPLCLFKGTS